MALMLAYIVVLATFFAWVGRRRGFWWVALPLLLGAGMEMLLAVLWVKRPALFTPVALSIAITPVVVAFANRSFGYRWWPAFSMKRWVVVTWLVMGGLLLLGALGLLIGLALFM